MIPDSIRISTIGSAITGGGLRARARARSVRTSSPITHSEIVNVLMAIAEILGIDTVGEIRLMNTS